MKIAPPPTEWIGKLNSKEGLAMITMEGIIKDSGTASTGVPHTQNFGDAQHSPQHNQALHERQDK
jgi:hypothetical protein